MKRIAAFLLLSFVLTQAHAQFGHEWIDFNQAYFKVPVGKDGLHKIDYAALQAAGMPVNAVDPRTFRLFHRGTEQAIAVAGESDSQFDPADYIEFYGKRNDGTLDADLYKPSSLQPHAYYNLYSDTTSYFLTYGAGLGKRMDLFFENNAGGLPAETYHSDEKLLLLTDQYSLGTDYGIEVINTFFDSGEGWTGALTVKGQSRDYILPGINTQATAAGVPQLEVLLVGRGTMAHQAEIYVGPTLRLLATASFSGFTTYKVVQDIGWSDIAGDGSLTVRVKVAGVGDIDWVSASYVKLKYPQQTNAGGGTEKVFSLAANGGGKSYIEIQNPSAGTRLFDITDPANVIRIGTTATSTLNAVVSSTASARKILATSVVTTTIPKAVAFRQITPASHDYIIISHPLLRKPALGYSDPVKAYAEYRASEEGGRYDTLVVNIGQLYDQFNYGEQSPRAIFQFMKFLAASHVPRYLFLIGKGLDLDYQYYRYPGLYSNYKDLVPSAGMPASDMVYTAGLAGTTVDPAVATGRITAMHPEEVAAYLNKVKETEARPFNDLTRKNILHLSGGIEEGEPELFRSYMESFATTAKGYYLGGKVSSIAKRSTDIELINIADEVNKGLGMVTFFGHSSPSTLDFDIGYVTDPIMGYNNPGKYPMMLMNGCNAGAFFLDNLLFGEDWILAANKGAVGFIAHSSFGLLSNLRFYSDTFYNIGFGDSTYIHKGIGDIQKETARLYTIQQGTSVANTTQVQQMILLGDPAVPLFGARKSDLETNDDNVSLESFDEGPVTALTDSFALKIIVRNFGQAKKDTMQIQVKRYLNDNTLIVYDSLYPSTLYSDTLTFVIRKGRESGGGNNRFEVTIDPDNVVMELRKDNNTASIEFPISLNGTKNLFPSSCAIVNSMDVNLSFQTTDLLSGKRSFTVEVDTVNTFDSPYRKTFTVEGTVLARQPFALLDKDTLAYYWRTKLAEPLAGESDAWTVSSFTFIDDGPEGWAQVHFSQYLENETDGLIRDVSARKMNFKETVTSVVVKTFGSAYPATNTDVSVKIDGAEYNLFTQSGGGFGCRRNTLNLIAFDRRSTVPYIGIPFKWYNRLERACGREPWVINSFIYAEMITGNNDDLVKYVDSVAPGDSVLLFTIGDALYYLWPAAAKAKLGELGVSVAQIDALQPGEPVVIFGKKGIAPGSAKVFRPSVAPPNEQQLDVSQTITGRYTSASMTSKLIGPAQTWQSFVVKASDVEAQDIVQYDIVGVKLNGTEELLLGGLTDDYDISGISAEDYPYLKVAYKTSDDINLTASQLDRWLVLFTPAPEGILIYKGDRAQQVLSEGQAWQGSYGFVNISDKTFSDSLTVRTELFNNNQHLSQENLFRIKPPLPGDTTSFDLEFSTTQRAGLNDVNVFVNPRTLPEQYYDNNVLAMTDYLNVQRDFFNPVLDVTIDGRYVSNNDFISPDPFILIRLWDENRNILKKDTDGVRIFLTYPCDQEVCTPTAIELTSDVIKWYPATNDADFRIEFKPQDLPEGKYTLRVEAADTRGNSSGAEPYEIDLMVKHETTVTVSDPHPNPFSTEVYFTIVLSGDELPGTFALQLVDVNGKIIRTFSKEALPEFHIGTNVLRWDGTDTGGNALPPAIYIYKLSLATTDQQVSKQGKVVLVR